MANLMDYMAWRGEFGFDKAPWNDVDALIHEWVPEVVGIVKDQPE